MEYKNAYNATRAALDGNFDSANNLCKTIKNKELQEEVNGLVNMLKKGCCQPEIAEIISDSYAREVIMYEITSVSLVV